MRGGTLLHKVHRAPASRYSEDIDLVLVGDRPEEHTRRAIRRVLADVLGLIPVPNFQSEPPLVGSYKAFNKSFHEHCSIRRGRDVRIRRRGRISAASR